MEPSFLPISSRLSMTTLNEQMAEDLSKGRPNGNTKTCKNSASFVPVVQRPNPDDRSRLKHIGSHCLPIGTNDFTNERAVAVSLTVLLEGRSLMIILPSRHQATSTSIR